MKPNYYYSVLFGYAGDCAEEITIVKAQSRKHLNLLGFKQTKDISIYRFNSLCEAEEWTIKNNVGYPKQRIKYWG